jgi:hypothetical protein
MYLYQTAETAETAETASTFQKIVILFPYLRYFSSNLLSLPLVTSAAGGRRPTGEREMVVGNFTSYA